METPETLITVGARMREAREFDDILGAYVFDGQRNRVGYHLNMFCKSLDVKANRDAFRASPEK